MSTIELRKEVINSLVNADERFLRMVYALYKSYTKKETDTFEALPEEIQELILQSRESVKEGKVFSHKEVMEEATHKYRTSR